MNFYRLSYEEKIKLFDKLISTKETYPKLSLTKIAERFGIGFWKFISLRRFIEKEAENGNQRCIELIEKYKNIQ